MKQIVIVRKTTWEDLSVEVEVPLNSTVRQIKEMAVEMASTGSSHATMSTETNFEAVTIEGRRQCSNFERSEIVCSTLLAFLVAGCGKET